MRAFTWNRAAATIAASSLTLALSGCLGGVGGNSDDDANQVPVGAESTNVAGTTATLTGNQVSTACFDFTTPDIGADWVLHPEPLNCVADVNWPDSDNLTMIRVRAQTGEVSPEDMEETFREAGYESIEASESSVDGQAAYTFALEDGFGLQQTIVIIELPAGRFSVDDVPLTAIFVGGYSIGEGDQNQIQQIVDSIDIH